MNEKLQDILNHVDQAVALACDPKFIKKIKWSGFEISVFSMFVTVFSILLFGGSVITNELFLAVSTIGAGSLVGFSVAWWSGGVSEKARTNFLASYSDVGKYELSPASDELKLSILKKAKDCVDSVVFKQLADISERTDVPSGWWLCVSGCLQNEHNNDPQRDQKICEELHIMRNVEDDCIIQTNCSQHMKI